jgi:hypothetical protein
MLITDRDMMILRDWFEPYKFATKKMIEKAFLKDNVYGYNIASKRLLEMKKADYIKVQKDKSLIKIFIFIMRKMLKYLVIIGY